MSPIKKTKHAVYDLKYHFVWIPKYRKKLLTGEVAVYVRQVFVRIAREYGWEIEEVAIEPDHVHTGQSPFSGERVKTGLSPFGQ